MENWPEYTICEATVVFSVVLSGEIERDVGNLVVDDFLFRDLALRGDPSLQPNQVPDFCLSAAFTATSSPPARALVSLSGTATLFETITSCPNNDPLRYMITAGSATTRGENRGNIAQVSNDVPLLLEVNGLGVELHAPERGTGRNVPAHWAP